MDMDEFLNKATQTKKRRKKKSITLIWTLKKKKRMSSIILSYGAKSRKQNLNGNKDFMQS